MKKLSFIFITIFLFFNMTYAHEEWTGWDVEDILFELSSYSGKQVHAVGFFMLNKNIEWKQAIIYDRSLDDNKLIRAKVLLQDTKFKTIYKYCEKVMQTENNGKSHDDYMPCGFGMFHLNMRNSSNMDHYINHIIFNLSDGSPKHF